MHKIIEAPVLLIIFNRPDTTQVVFDTIRKAKPAKLYISADGPRAGNENDKTNCEKTRRIVKNVDWDCDVHYRFLDDNLGCGFGVLSGISWAFENEDRLIILEDDCVPSLPFFDFCCHCLEKYKDDTRVWSINGSYSHLNKIIFEKYDYIFSCYPHCGGWSTWKRCWNDFDINMNNWHQFILSGGFYNVFFSKREAVFFNNLYTKLTSDKSLKNHSWAYSFRFYILSNRGLSIVPAKNLIKNIGFFGVHSDGNVSFVHNQETFNEFTFNNEPLFVLPNREYDYYHFKHHELKAIGKPALFKRIISKGLKTLGLSTLVLRYKSNSLK